MKELNQITNQIISESEELIKNLEETLELEEIRQELTELEIQHHKMNKIMLSVGSMTALYSLMLVVKIIMIAIQQIAFLKGEINILYREVIQSDVSLMKG